MKRILLGAVAALAMGATAASAGTLADVKARGTLICIVNSGFVGFASTDKDGKWQGYDVDYCKATAAAVLGDASKVKYKPATGKTRFTILNSGEGDVLWRNTTWTFVRDVDVKLAFQGVNYYDGQGFMVPKKLGVKSAKELDGASVCIQTGTTTELNLAEYFRINNMKYEPVVTENNEESRRNLLAGRCDVYTTDASGLAATRATFKDPENWVLLPEIISKEPLGPVTRHGDDNWSDIIRWVKNAMLAAEELGVTQANVDAMGAKAGNNPEINRLLGTEADLGGMLGLDKKWAARAIKAVGNFGEIFERNIGKNTPVGLERGLNDLWTNGGLQYTPPFR